MAENSGEGGERLVSLSAEQAGAAREHRWQERRVRKLQKAMAARRGITKEEEGLK